MDKLIEGYRRFRREAWPARRAAYEALARHGQSPLAAVIACADSRVDPSLIFDAAPGALFVIRNVANLVPPYAPDASYHGTSAALEFAVRGLRVPLVVVMGHAMCGGVRALVEGTELGDFVAPWMRLAARALDRARSLPEAEKLCACEHETVRISLENLMTFPWVAAAVEAGRLRLEGAFYGVASGVLEVLQPDGSFAPVV